MSSTVTFYTSSVFDNSPAVNFSDADDANKQNVFDYQNQNTYWTAPAGLDRYIFLDTHPQNSTAEAAAYSAGRGQPSGSRSSISIRLSNYNTDMSSTELIVYDSIFNSSTIHVLSAPNTMWEHGVGNPLYVIDLDEPITRRYVRVNFVNPPADAKVSFIGVHNKRVIQTRPKWPIKIIDEYHNNVVNMGGGLEYKSSRTGNFTSSFDQMYTFRSVANKTTFDKVFHDSNGGLYPIIYQPGTTQSEMYLCRLDHDKWAPVERFRHNWRVALKFKTLPYIEDGSLI